jgi:hypothetical protein
MSTHRQALVVLLALAIVQAHAEAQPAGLQRCPSIEDPAARLACFDAAMPPTSAAARSLPAQGVSASRAAAPGETSGRAGEPAAGRAAFGFPARQVGDEIQSIESMTVPGFREWGPNSRIRLDNGQVWQVIDGSSGSLLSIPSKVTITKGVWGAYFMSFQERNWSPKVKRVE